MRNFTAFILLFARLLYADSLLTRTEAVYGPEFTFTSSLGEVTEPMRAALLERMYQHLVMGQPPGQQFIRVKPSANTEKFISPKGWWFEVTINPGVIEIKMNPMTVAEFKRFAGDIQDAIFVSAANVNLFPWTFLGGGHINVGLQAFGSDTLLARNFIVDFWNHNELSMGIFGYDTNNAVPLSLNTLEVQQEVARLIAEFDARPMKWSAAAVRTFLLKFGEAKSKSPPRLAWGKNLLTSKYVDLNFNPVSFASSASRLEIRAVRPQPNMDTWIRQIELLDQRIHFLRTLHTAIPMKQIVPLNLLLDLSFEPDGHLLNPPLDPHLALKAFYQYVSESGLEWADHRDYLWPRWVETGELAKFEQSTWFKRQELRSQMRARNAQRLKVRPACAMALTRE